MKATLEAPPHAAAAMAVRARIEAGPSPFARRVAHEFLRVVDPRR